MHKNNGRFGVSPKEILSSAHEVGGSNPISRTKCPLLVFFKPWGGKGEGFEENTKAFKKAKFAKSEIGIFFFKNFRYAKNLPFFFVFFKKFGFISPRNEIIISTS